ncbi:hypothetical protein, partial [Mycobacterium tuberculosis]
SGLDPAAAQRAHVQMAQLAKHAGDVDAPPAMVRASAVWRRATRAALAVCDGIAVPGSAQLVVRR